MKLSIIVPVYNMAAEDKLIHCLDSLVKQTILDTSTEKVIISEKFKLCKAFNIYSYWPKSNNIKDPEIPGKIIAQIAIIPDINNTGSEWLAAIGFKLTKT